MRKYPYGSNRADGERPAQDQREFRNPELEDLESALSKRLDVVDKLIRWQVGVLSGVVAIAIWGTTMNLRVSTLEQDRAPAKVWERSYDLWRVRADNATGMDDPEYGVRGTNRGPK
jgi:hypothetical protein